MKIERNPGIVPPWLRDPIRILPIVDKLAFIPDDRYRPPYTAPATRGARLIKPGEEL